MADRSQLTPEPFFLPESGVFRWVTGIVIVVTYIGAVVATYVLIFLVALGHANLPTVFMDGLGVAALAELVPVFLLFTRAVWGIPKGRT